VTQEFEREQRYVVLKVKDVMQRLSEKDILMLARILDEIDAYRKSIGKKSLECVVIESDWPEYEPTWKAIEARVTGAQNVAGVPTALLVTAADLVAQVEIVARSGFIDMPDDKDSCAAFCVAEGAWLELMSAVESLASALAATTEAKP